MKEKNGSTVVVVLNFSDQPQTVKLTLPEAALQTAMGEGEVDAWAEGQTLSPFGYAVLATES